MNAVQAAALSADLHQYVSTLVEACNQLLPPDDRNKIYLPRLQLGFMLNVIADLLNPACRIQISHIDFLKAFVIQAQAIGVRAFVVTHSLSPEGAYLRVHQTFTEEDPNSHNGVLVHVPEGTCFIQPWSMIHAGGFRTGPLGNPRLHTVVFMVPKESLVAWNVMATPVFTQEYIGIDDNHTRHDYEVTSLTGDTDELEDPPHSYLGAQYLEDFLQQVAH